MTPPNLKQLEDSLWEAADCLRANSKLTPAEYTMPVLGLIFLRHASSRFDRVRERISRRRPSPLTAADFVGTGTIFLPTIAQYTTIAQLPESQDIGVALDLAMKTLEDQVPDLLRDVLPKTYSQLDQNLLRNLVRVFDSTELRSPTGDDLFGRIYEYFLNKFAMSGAHEGGEFFTPPSLVRMIVNFIEPTHGLVLDPAVGSAGMFVQAAHAAQDRPPETVHFVGQEKSDTNTKLARMNLAVHELNGTIRRGNSFYDRLDDLIGRCDFVMANPPFNVDMVDPTKLIGDRRLFAHVDELGIRKKTQTISNANYLWIQYFHGYLKPNGRAGFVMPQSATDAGHWERSIREQLVATGDVDIMVSIGTHFFYTRPLPCSLWFFDRGRPRGRRHTTLMLDVRSIYRVISRKVRDFSEEQLANLTAIVWLYRGQTGRYLQLIRSYLAASSKAMATLGETLTKIDVPNDRLTGLLDGLLRGAPNDVDKDKFSRLEATVHERREIVTDLQDTRKKLLADLSVWRDEQGPEIPATNARQVARRRSFQAFLERLSSLQRQLDEASRLTTRAFDMARRDLRAITWDAWDKLATDSHREALRQARDNALSALHAVTFPIDQVIWLQSRFPNARFTEVPGLCKVVTTKDIAGQDYSLTPGRYVGIAPPESESEEAVGARLRQLHAELAKLNKEAAALAATITTNFEDLVE